MKEKYTALRKISSEEEGNATITGEKTLYLYALKFEVIITPYGNRGWYF